VRGLEGKVVIVTGGAGGIGKATCSRFAQAGSKVAVFDLNADATAAMVAELNESGLQAAAYIVDLTNYEAVDKAVADVESDLGPIDILVNNAGWDIFTPFLKSDPAYWQKIIDINLITALNTHRCILPAMVERGVGRVVNISSDAARVGSSGEAVYAACKAGIIALSKTLAREHARDGITFNVVCPGLTETAMLEDFLAAAGGDPEKLRGAFRRAVPLGRLGKPEDLPGAILFLSSDDAAFRTGQVISVSGGLTMNG
jgi:2-hydroxycyclohexanecarboxyl-CoA dehydrogenase